VLRGAYDSGVSDPPAPPTTSDIPPPIRRWRVGRAVAAVLAVVVALFLAAGWLLQRVGLLNHAVAP
jgi:hypothetical protein